MKNTKKGGNSGEEKDGTETINCDTTALDEILNHMDQGSFHEVKVKDF